MDRTSLEKCGFLTFIFIAIQMILSTAETTYKTHYLEDYCSSSYHKPIRLDPINARSSAIISLSRSGHYQDGMHCQLKIKPPFDDSSRENSSEEDDYTPAERFPAEFGVVLSIKTINLRMGLKGICLDLITVKQKIRSSWLPILSGCASNLSGTAVASSAERDRRDLMIEFRSSEYGPLVPQGSGFDITVTSFAIKTVKGCPPAWGGDSTTDWFGCSTKDRCVWRGLTCDGRDNCGDESDEWLEDGAKCGTNRKQAIMGVGISLAVVAVLAVLIMVCCNKKKKGGCRGSHPEPSAPLLNPTEGPRDSQRRRLLNSDQTSGHREYGTNSEELPPPPPYSPEEPFPPPPPPPYRE